MTQDAKYEPQVFRKEGGTGMVFGSGSTVEDYRAGGTSSTVATISTSKYLAPIQQTTFTLTATPVSIKDSAASGAAGYIKLFDWPAGKIGILGALMDITKVKVQAIAAATGSILDLSLGTVSAIGKTPNGALTGATYVNICPKMDVTCTGYSGSGRSTKVAFGSADGTTTAADIYLNIANTSAKQSANGTAWVTGTIRVDWYNIGDV